MVDIINVEYFIVDCVFVDLQRVISKSAKERKIISNTQLEHFQS